MKLLLLTRSLHEGGAERQIVTLARAMAARGEPPAVAVFYGGGKLEAELNAAGVRLRYLDKGGRWDIAAFAYRVMAHIRAEKPDVVYAMLPTANLIASCLRVASPGVRVVWGVRASRVDNGDYDALNRWTLRLHRMLARTTSGIIVNSHAGYRDLVEEGYPEDRLWVVHNGIDVESFSRSEQGRERVRREWGVRQDESLVGIVARFDPMKDHGTFIAAAARVATRRPDSRFVCVGAAPAAPLAEAREKVEAAGLTDRFLFSGPRRDMSDVYSALDLCVLSSAYGEGFPNVLGESMACGTQCVATAVGDAPVILDGWGHIVPPRDPNALADHMVTALDNPPTAEWRRAARSHICERFSVEAMLTATERVLRPVAIGGNGGDEAYG